jgi:hypothetical protein
MAQSTAEAAVTNGSTPSLDDVKRAQELINAHRKALRAKARPKAAPSLPVVAAPSEMNEANYSCKVDKSAIDWNDLENFQTFSTNPEGYQPMVKVSVSKAVILASRQSVKAGSGRVFRIYF